jgi:hypothetical protein
MLGIYAAAVFGLVLLVLTGLAWTRPRSSESPVHPGSASGIPRNVPAYSINNPIHQPADAARLADDEPVLGVCLDGRYRAYSVRALGGSPPNHVVNDRLGEYPVSVAYCDRTGCALVVQGEKEKPLLNLAFGGWHGNQMYVRADGQFVYSLATLAAVDAGSPSFPYKGMEFEETTWGAWRRAHPETDVYVQGQRPVAR